MHRHTPFLPALRWALAPMGSRLARSAHQVSAYTLCQLESALGGWVPTHCLGQSRARGGLHWTHPPPGRWPAPTSSLSPQRLAHPVETQRHPLALAQPPPVGRAAQRNDPAGRLYPAQQILQAYLRRWRLEMCLDDLKTTLKLDFVRARSPQMAQKEVLLRLIAHNLIRCTAAQAAVEHAVALDRFSFKGSVDALRHFASAMAQARSHNKRQQLWAQLLHTLATDLVPERPNRREPRAIKRKKHKYPRLNVPRRQFRDRPKRNLRRTRAKLRRLGLM